MRRISTYRLVVVLPLLVAVVIVVWREHRRFLYSGSLHSFRTEQADEGWAHLGNIETGEGTYVTRMVVTELMRHDERIVFDGDSRCVQLVAARLPDKHADGIAMYRLGNHYETKYTAGLTGSKIKSADFDGDELVIKCYGRIKVFDPMSNLNPTIDVPEASPDEIRFPWNRSSPVPSCPELREVMLEHYRDAFREH